MPFTNLSREQIAQFTAVLGEARETLQCESSALFWANGDEIRLVAASSDRDDGRIGDYKMPIASKRATGLTSHIADLLRNGAWPADDPDPNPENPYFANDAVSLFGEQLQSNRYVAAAPMPHLHDRSWSILGVPVRHPKTGAFLGLLKFHNRQNGAAELPFDGRDAAIARLFAEKLVNVSHAGTVQGVRSGEFWSTSLLEILNTRSAEDAIRKLLEHTVALAASLAGASSVLASFDASNLLGFGEERNRAETEFTAAFPPDSDHTLAQRLLKSSRVNKQETTHTPKEAESQCGFAITFGHGCGAVAVVFDHAVLDGFIESARRAIAGLVAPHYDIVIHFNRIAVVRNHAEVSSLNQTEAARSVNDKNDTQTAYEPLLRLICERFDWDFALLFVADRMHGGLRIHAQSGRDKTALGFTYLFKEEDALAVRAWRDNRTHLSEDPAADGKLAMRGRRQFEIDHACMAVPVCPSSAKGSPLGVAVFWSRDRERRPRRSQAAEALALCYCLGDLIASSNSLRRQVHLLEGITNINQKALLAASREEMLDAIMEAVRSAGLQRVRRFRYDSSARSFVGVKSLGMLASESIEGLTISGAENPFAADTIDSVSQGAIRATIYRNQGEPRSADIGTAPGLEKPDPDARRLFKDPGIPWVILPLVSGGTLVGQIAADTGFPHRIPDHTLRYLDLLVELACLHLSELPARSRNAPPIFDQLLSVIATNCQGNAAISESLDSLGANPPGELVQRLRHWAKIQLERDARFLEVVSDWRHLQNSSPREPRSAHTSLREVAQACYARRESLAAARRVMITIHCPYGLRGMVEAPQSDVFILLDNILHNAILVSPFGAEVRVRIRTSERGPVVEIEDHGPGVPADQRQDLIFEPFVSIPRRPPSQDPNSIDFASLPHTGLGLFVVRQIAVRNGITVSCRPTEGMQGTVFSVCFPAPKAAIPLD
ncbi:MAG: hypothetical protein JNM66_20245 [Bryobacterales bacterium]|nr:hypothetical protein [Bryobacterales bacterium]